MLVVLAILMAVAVPSLAPQDVERLDAAADILAADLRLAQSLALRDATDMTLTLTATGWKIEHTGTGAAPVLPVPTLGGVGTGYEIDIAVLVGRPIQIVGRLNPAQSSTASVAFTATGRTASVQDTVLWLTIGTGAEARSRPLVISAPTGLVTAGEIVVGVPPDGSS